MGMTRWALQICLMVVALVSGMGACAAANNTLIQPVIGTIIKDYNKAINSGVDFSASPGSDILAANDGQVAAITADKTGMPILVIVHKDNLMTVYANLAKIRVYKGDSVVRGQKIGEISQKSPSYLHFEVRKNGQPVNPKDYFLVKQSKKTQKPEPSLKLAFISLQKSQRKLVQTHLQYFGFYKSVIDGLYGKNTRLALEQYNKRYFGSADLTNSKNASDLLALVLKHYPPSSIKPPEFANKPNVQIPTVEKPESEAKPQPKPKPEETFKVASGTGFYVSNGGHIITNHHVIDGCKDIKVHSKGEVLKTIKIADDRQNDLALLKASHRPSHVFPLSNDSPYPLQDIVVAGFPFGDRVSSSLKFTKGIVSSLSGIGNNYSEIQIDAAIQPGNSGGPIMDEYGNIIAVAVSKLDMKKILKDYGVIPENTNFGIKASAVKNLLEGNAVSFKKPNTEVLPKQELSRVATDGTVFLSCWMTVAQMEDMKNRKVLFTDLE